MMPGKQQIETDLRPWAAGDLPLLEQLLGDPMMTQYLGGPESPARLRDRHARYYRPDNPDQSRMFVIVAGSERVSVGSIGYWLNTWQAQEVWETGWSVLPAFQGQNIATRATAAIIERTRAEGTYRFLHAFPSVENGASNAVCRKAGFTWLGEYDFEYPPGHVMRCNDWQFDLK
jgi:RimJ/RimL family protein N-acetyltransferase